MKKHLYIIFLIFFWADASLSLPLCVDTDVRKWTNCKGEVNTPDGTKFIGAVSYTHLRAHET